MHTHIHTTLETINPDNWNALNQQNQPFLRYEFLVAMERHGVLGKVNGWFPRYFTVEDQGVLLGAAPCYIKTNSHGEFVFDWAWADAYRQSGLLYYPKLVSAVPYTPVSGERFLSLAEHLSPAQQYAVKELLLKRVIDYCEQSHLSSYHCLFSNSFKDTLDSRLLKRMDYQYHWTNQGYASFDDFLATFKSRKRRKTRREREIVKEAGYQFITLTGNQLSDSQWKQAFSFYINTFYEKGNKPVLTLPFFKEIAQTMGEQIVVVFAYKENPDMPCACAINFRDDTHLYGRYWGSIENAHSLHFETCFYQGIEYCIQEGLNVYEPGAQGEHKITRGFLPVETHSYHLIQDERFRAPIADYLERERLALIDYRPKLDDMSPFRDDDST